VYVVCGVQYRVLVKVMRDKASTVWSALGNHS
jgi:hypothetical protein